MDNYFPYHSLDQNDNANLFFHVNAGFHLLGPHLPLGPKAEEEQALAFVPHPTVIPPAVPVQPVPAHTVPSLPVLQRRPIDAEPMYHVEEPNVVPQLPPWLLRLYLPLML